MRKWNWTAIAAWVAVIVVIWQLMSINTQLTEMHRYMQHVEANTAKLGGTINVNIENEPLQVQTSN